MTSGSAPVFLDTTTITSAKLNWKNYSAWAASVQLWFLGEGYYDHLETEINSVPYENRSQWQKTDFQLCAVLWKSVEPDILEMLSSYKTCFSFWKNAQNSFANDIRRLFDAAQRVAALKQTNHDMVSHMAKARAAVEEVKRFLVGDSLDEIKKKLDRYYMVLILRSLHSDFDNLRDQILVSDQIPSIDGLITRLIRVSSLMKDENQIEVIESSPMEISHVQENSYSLHGLPDKTINVSKADKSESKISDEEYQEFLRYKYEKSINQGRVNQGKSAGVSQYVKGFTFSEINSVRASTGKVVCCHFSSDGNLLASGGHDKKAVLWFTDTLKQKATLEEHSSLITDVRFSPNMPRLATSSFDKTVRVWDLDNPGYSLRTFTGHSSPVMSLDFHPNKDDLICSCDVDGEIRYWSINNGSCARVSKGGTAQMRFQPRLGRYLAAAAENVVSILDVETQACRYSLKGHTKSIHSVCWDPSGEFLASVSEDSVRVWTLGSGSEGECVHELSCNGNKCHSCVFHPTYSSLLVVGCYQSLELWNMSENKTMTLSAHGGLIAALAVSTVNGLVASASHDKFVKLWK